MIALLRNIQKNGILKELVRGGIISTTTYFHMEIYLYVDAKIRSGMKKTEAVNYASDNFNVSPATIYKVLKKLKPE